MWLFHQYFCAQYIHISAQTRGAPLILYSYRIIIGTIYTLTLIILQYYSLNTTEYSIMTHHTASRLDPGFPPLVSRHKIRPPEYFFVRSRSGCKLKLSNRGALVAGSPPLLTLLVSLPFLQPGLRISSPEGRPLIRVPAIHASPTDSRVPLIHANEPLEGSKYPQHS